nr:Peptidase C19 ubiquitin carboxyl terminal hydrolase 2 [Hymenolepis microstoma]
MSHILMRVRNANSESSKTSNVVHHSKKKSVVALIKKAVDGSSRAQKQRDLIPGLSERSVENGFDGGKTSQDEVSNTTKTHRRNLSLSKSLENYHVRKKSTVSETGLKTPTPCGLENLGNTCYINAIMQCLHSTQPVREFCENYDGSRSKPSKNGTDLVPAFTYLVTKMNSVSSGSVNSSTLQRFKNAFAAHVPNYKGNLQQDALEFFTYLVDGLHEGIKEGSQTTSFSDPPSNHTTPFTLLPAIQRDPRLKRRRGGLKSNESSGHLTGGDREASSRKTSESSTRYFKKIARKLSEKVLRPLRSQGSYDLCHDTHQPAVSSADATASENSFLKDTFVGHLQTRLRCLQCKNLTTRDELFWNLSLCVPESSSSEKESKDKRVILKTNSSSPSATSSTTSEVTCVSLDDCLKAFTKAEILDDADRPICKKCKIRNKAELQIMISKLPKILVLQFQRFESSCCKTKKRNLIKFGFEQDMSPYYVGGSADEKIEVPHLKPTTIPKCFSSPAFLHPSDDAELPRSKSAVSMAASTQKLDLSEKSLSMNYQLYAVVYHQGGTDRGHYTARCRLPSNPVDSEQASWYFFDDENVSKVSSDQEVIHPTAYILFYVRMDSKPNPGSPSAESIGDEDRNSFTSETPVNFTTAVGEGPK